MEMVLFRMMGMHMSCMSWNDGNISIGYSHSLDLKLTLFCLWYSWHADWEENLLGDKPPGFAQFFSLLFLMNNLLLLFMNLYFAASFYTWSEMIKHFCNCILFKCCSDLFVILFLKRKLYPLFKKKIELWMRIREMKKTAHPWHIVVFILVSLLRS